MKKLTFLFYILLNTCSLFASPKYIKLVDKVTAKFMTEIGQEKKIYLTGYGGRLMNDVEEIGLSFDIIKHASITEARKLFVELAEEYLERINSDTQLRPFLHNYPFTIDNLDMEIGFDDEQHNFQIDLSYVGYSKRSGNIYYSVHDPEKMMLVTIYEEPYAEAVKLVKQSH